MLPQRRARPIISSGPVFGIGLLEVLLAELDEELEEMELELSVDRSELELSEWFEEELSGILEL